MLQHYDNIHGYLAVTICVLGTIFNIVNILVLSHKVTRSQWSCLYVPPQEIKYSDLDLSEYDPSFIECYI